MKTMWLRTMALACLICGPLAAYGADEPAAAGEGPGELMDFPLSAAVIQMIIFLLVVFVLGKFVWPKVLVALDARDKKIHDDITAAEQANAKAQEVLAEYEKFKADANAEARTLLDQARADAESLRRRLETEAEQDLARQRQRATEQIDQAKNAAVQEIYAQAGALALAVAGKILQRQIDEPDTQKLVDESLKELDQLGNAS